MQEFSTAAPTSRAPNPSLEELLAFERLLSDLSVRFANVAGDQVVAEIEGALKRLLKFLGFDRSAFWEFVDEEKEYFLCSVAVEGVEPPLRGPVPADLSWNITESKRAEEKLRATEKELTRVFRLTAAGQMAASIAHEIKQPLAAIVTGAAAGLRWLSKPKPDLEQVRALLKTIVGEGNRASEVIDGIRAIFKNDRRERTSLDVNEVIRDVLALMQFELHNHRILVQAELTAELPPVLADRIQLQQVAANLITNAIEAMQFAEGRARTLRVRSGIRIPDGVLIVVEDSGPGIDPENADRIFHPFFTTKPQGTGMGLSICRSIVEAHSGHLVVSPAADGGSVFQITLPAGDEGAAR